MTDCMKCEASGVARKDGKEINCCRTESGSKSNTDFRER